MRSENFEEFPLLQPVMLWSWCRTVKLKFLIQKHTICIHYGLGYRLYFVLFRKDCVILLTGGKKKTQQKDIEIAKSLAQSFTEGEQNEQI